jgi:Protein of unknown function (DUF3592)
MADNHLVDLLGATWLAVVYAACYLVVLVGGLGRLVRSVNALRWEIRANRHGLVADGTVVGVQRRSGGEGADSLVRLVSFTAADGRRYVIEGAATGTEVRIDDVTIVRYHPAAPARATVYGPGATPYFRRIVTLIGTALAITVIAALGVVPFGLLLNP